MYEEEKNSINWFKVVLRIVIVLLVILLSIKLITIIVGNKTNVKESNVLEQSLKAMDKVANEYFKGDLLPENIGESKEVTLEELINNKLIDEIKDNKGKKCDVKKSYIKATKLDKQYQIKSNLVCQDQEDYINSFINIEEPTTSKTTVTTTKTTVATTKVNTTKANTTKKTNPVSIKKFTVSFNSNGGSVVDAQTVNESSTIKNVVPTREGYTFVGWYYHGTKFDINTKINQNYVLTAKWIIG